MIPPFENLTPDQIVKLPYLEDESAWHVHAALSWAYYADRVSAPIALHYSGFHLRYGIECLWMKIFSASRGQSFTVAEYQRALRSATKLYKLIDSFAPEYAKFAEFDQIIQSIDPAMHPPTVVWDFVALRRIHGSCSEFLLHLQDRSSNDGHLSTDWTAKRLGFVRESATWIWNTMKTKGNLIVYHPDGLAPKVRGVWESFRVGDTDAEGARIRLRIIRPML